VGATLEDHHQYARATNGTASGRQKNEEIPVNIQTVKLELPPEANIILGQAHFIKTVEDLYEAMVSSVPDSRFGIAFCEASQDRLVRTEGNDPELKGLAAKNALAIGAGHSFLVLMKDIFPINVLPRIRECPEVCRIFCATANPVEVLVTETDLGRAILGVVDGSTPVGIEEEEDVRKRKAFLRQIGYKR
jgi:adenosine/AMP kinase